MNNQEKRLIFFQFSREILPLKKIRNLIKVFLAGNLPILEWLPRLRLKGSALPLSGSVGSESFGDFFGFYIFCDMSF
jgi:hypothetical protein